MDISINFKKRKVNIRSFIYFSAMSHVSDFQNEFQVPSIWTRLMILDNGIAPNKTLERCDNKIIGMIDNFSVAATKENSSIPQ